MIARLLLSSLLNALLTKIDSELTRKDAAEMMAKINDSICNMLQSSSQFYTPFIACLLVRVMLSRELFCFVWPGNKRQLTGFCG